MAHIYSPTTSHLPALGASHHGHGPSPVQSPGPPFHHLGYDTSLFSAPTVPQNQHTHRLGCPEKCLHPSLHQHLPAITSTINPISRATPVIKGNPVAFLCYPGMAGQVSPITIDNATSSGYASTSVILIIVFRGSLALSGCSESRPHFVKPQLMIVVNLRYPVS